MTKFSFSDLFPRNGRTLRVLVFERTPSAAARPGDSCDEEQCSAELRRNHRGKMSLTRANDVNDAIQRVAQGEVDVVLARSLVAISRLSTEVLQVVEACIRTKTTFVVPDEDIDSRSPDWRRRVCETAMGIRSAKLLETFARERMSTAQAP